MSKMNIPVQGITPVEGQQYIEIEVYYSKGGINYFTYENDPRGYYLSVQPITAYPSENNGFSSTYMAFTGFKKFIQEATRKSDKQMASAWITAKPSMLEMVTTVMQRNNLSFLDETKALQALAVQELSL